MIKIFIVFCFMFICNILYASNPVMSLYMPRAYFLSEDPAKHILFHGGIYPIYKSATYQVDSYTIESDPTGPILLNLYFKNDVCIENDGSSPVNVLLGFGDNLFVELYIPTGSYSYLPISLYDQNYEDFLLAKSGKRTSKPIPHTRVSSLVFSLTTIINMFTQDNVISEKTVEFYATYFWVFLILIYVVCGGLIASTFFVIQKRFSQIGFILSLTLPGVLFFLLILGIICFVTPYVVCIEKSII